MTLIEREALIRVFVDAEPDVVADYGPDCGSEWGFSQEAVAKIIQGAPTIDIAPVVHGRWIFKQKVARTPFARNYYCSNCGYEPLETIEYCAHCGARMDGGEGYEAD